MHCLNEPANVITFVGKYLIQLLSKQIIKHFIITQRKMCYKENTFYKFNKKPIVSYIFHFISRKSYPCCFPSLFSVISINHLMSLKFMFIDLSCFQCKVVLIISLMMNNVFKSIIQCNTKFNIFSLFLFIMSKQSVIVFWPGSDGVCL